MGKALSRRQGCCLALLLLLLLLAAALAAALTAALSPARCAPPRVRRAAVAADTRTCSEIGSSAVEASASAEKLHETAVRDILQRGGSAVDAAIAALICTSVLNPQSMGLGGGVIFTIYNASTGHVEVLNAREKAPKTIAGDLLGSCRDTLLPGPAWIAVPGELRGYEEAHRRHGKLPWKSLFEPTIELLAPGIRVPEVLSKFLAYLQLYVRKTSLCKLFCDDQGTVLKAGQTLHWPALVKTLRAVAENGASEFYTGKTAERLVHDANEEGSTLTLDDLRNYRIETMRPVKMPLAQYTLYSAPRPAAGPILFFILNVLKGFNFTKDSMNTLSRTAEAYHYIAEALKFANGQRAKMDDPHFSEIKEDVMTELMSDSFAARVRQLIDDRGDHPPKYYNLTQPGAGHFGTSHVSVLAEDGSAVSATSTINHAFGSMVYSQQTGILLNNELADFCMKWSSRSITEGEMPPSSMVPSILISRDGQSKLVIGGSGGTQIIPAVALAIANMLWFGYDLDGAIRAPVLFATRNGSIEVEPGFRQNIMEALQEKGHTIHTAKLPLNVVQGISKDGRCIFPYSDARKQGEASGY